MVKDTPKSGKWGKPSRLPADVEDALRRLRADQSIDWTEVCDGSGQRWMVARRYDCETCGDYIAARIEHEEMWGE